MKASPADIEKQFSEALSYGENSGNVFVTVISLIQIALERISFGSSEGAVTILKKAVILSKNSGNKPALIKALYGLALIDSFTGEPVRATITTLSLIQNSSADFQSETLCVALIGKLRKLLGDQRMDILKTDTDTIILEDLIDLYKIDSAQFKE